MAEESTGICGFQLADGSLCLTEAKHRCILHETLCAGCSETATRECTICSVHLCHSCEHRGPGKHGKKLSVRETAEQDLTSTLREVLADAQTSGLCQLTAGREEELARFVLHQLSMHITLSILSGMAAPPT